MDSGVLDDWRCSGYSAEDEVNSSSDELLCRRVESAVRKFTEELILCERRARDRSRSNTRRWDKRTVSIYMYISIAVALYARARARLAASSFAQRKSYETEVKDLFYFAFTYIFSLDNTSKNS